MDQESKEERRGEEESLEERTERNVVESCTEENGGGAPCARTIGEGWPAKEKGGMITTREEDSKTPGGERRDST